MKFFLDTFVTFAGTMAIVLLGTVASLEAQTPEIFDDWKLLCDETGCEISQALQTSTDGQRFLTITIRQGQDDDVPQVLIRLPLGIALQPGVKVFASDSTWHFPFVACYPDGCMVSEEAPTEMIEAFKTAAAADVRFFAAVSNEQVSATISLRGFQSAYEAVKLHRRS